MIVCFVLFLLLVAGCLVLGRSIFWAILGGLVLFALLALRQGFAPRAIWRMAWGQARKTLPVLRILALIGVITGLWRASGTIALCVVWGGALITPRWFLLTVFFSTCLLSYVLGTSFGVVGTAGVAFMALARFGGVDEVLAAGVILSGIYFGDRCSPASSSASLVAAVTETDLYSNVHLMLRTGALPLALTAVLYALLSSRAPLTAVDQSLLGAFSAAFSLTPWAAVPAALMLVLPLFRVPILVTMAAISRSAAALAVGVQGFSLWETAKIALLGYHPGGALGPVLSGGGLVSMVTVLLLLPVTGMYTGILEGIGAFHPLERQAASAAGRVGRLPVTAAATLLCAAVFCNQSVAVMLGSQFMSGCYADQRELAQDLENTGILFAGMVPWAIACSVPLAVLEVGYGAVGYAFLLWLIPLCYFFTKRWFFKEAAS